MYEFCQFLDKNFNLHKPQALHLQSRHDDGSHICWEAWTMLWELIDVKNLE